MRDPEYQGELTPGKAKAAKYISLLTYPPFMGIIAFAAISIWLAEGMTSVITFAIGIMTATVLPLVISLYFAKKVKDTDEFGDIRNSRDRLVPMALIICVYLLGAALLYLADCPAASYLSMVSYACSTLFALAVSSKWKISLHAMGVVGPATMLAICFWPWGALVFLILPPVCWSRYVQRNHTLLQLVAGSVFGTLITYLVFLLLGGIRTETALAGRRVSVYPGASPDAPLVVLNSYEGDGSDVLGELREMTDADLSLASIAVEDWNDSMSPWPAEPVFGGEPFGGRADEYLSELCGTIIPGIRSIVGEPSEVIIAGYSMAGLFALYSAFRTDAFSAVVSASGSLWYPGIVDFMDSHNISRSVGRVYLSLGDAEGRTRNRTMARVGESTEEALGIMTARGIEAVLEINPGNHFREPARRMAKGISWALRDRPFRRKISIIYSK